MGVSIPAEPTVYVERHASGASCAWEAAGLEQFLTAVGDAAGAADPTVTVDARSVAGRQPLPVSAVDPADTTYVRFEPPAGWRLAWERRTTPVVTLDGTVSPKRCRRLHRATTADAAWPPTAQTRLVELLGEE
ncbi:hypothetical protein [Halobaculum sp. MBLA0143]|uniref:hypothetical protein n=1 Tax=Halobaculum sp. MBLA0143 TaxID=3079933 RepID=UPI0035251B3F